MSVFASVAQEFRLYRTKYTTKYVIMTYLSMNIKLKKYFMKVLCGTNFEFY